MNIENITAEASIPAQHAKQFLKGKKRTNLRLHSPCATVQIFSSGKLICTGTKLPEHAKRAINNCVFQIESTIKTKIARPTITISNMVFTMQITLQSINLNTLASEHPETEYEPEQFSALIFRIPGSSKTALVFSSGKIVITGCLNEQEAQEAVEYISAKLNVPKDYR